MNQKVKLISVFFLCFTFSSCTSYDDEAEHDLSNSIGNEITKDSVSNVLDFESEKTSEFSTKIEEPEQTELEVPSTEPTL